MDGCIDAFIVNFGRRAYRRPLLSEEIALARALYDVGRETSAREGFTSLIDFFLQSPALLYQIEYGESPVEGSADRYRLGAYELATRLSYFLWNSTPDTTLLAAAESGDLSTREGLEAQARRLVDDPRFYDSIVPFHRDLTRAYRIDEVAHDDPDFTDLMRSSMWRDLPALEAADDRGELTFEGIFEPILPNHSRARPTLGRTARLLAKYPQPRGSRHGGHGSIARREIKTPPSCGQLHPGEISAKGPGIQPDHKHLSEASRAPRGLASRNPVQRMLHHKPTGFALEQYDALVGFDPRKTEPQSMPPAALTCLLRRRILRKHGFPGTYRAKRKPRTCYVDQWVHAALGTPLARLCTVNEPAHGTHLATTSELLVQITLTDHFRQREIKENE